MEANRPFPYFQLCFVFINIVYLWETYLDWRQHQKYKIKIIPTQVKAIGVTEEKFLKAQEYGLAKSTFGFYEKAFEHLLTVLSLQFGLLPYLWNISGDILTYIGLSSEYEILQSIIFVIIYGIFETLLGQPWSIYRTFVIEEAFGFNKTTAKTFVTDILQTIGLSIAIGVPIIAAFIWIVKWGGEQFYLYLWVFMQVVSIIMITIYPTIIQPIFNKVEELDAGELRTAIEELAKKTDFPLTALYKIDGSKRSGHSNAYFYGFFKNKRIVLYDTLIEQSTKEQVVAVLGHELGHYFLNHTIQFLVISGVHMLILFYFFGQMVHNPDIYTSFGFSTMPTVIGFMLFNQVLNPVDHVVNFLMNGLSRYNEFQADAFSVKLGYPEDLSSGLIKLQTENLSTMIPDSLFSLYHYSHPPLTERLDAIQALKKKSN